MTFDTDVLEVVQRLSKGQWCDQTSSALIRTAVQPPRSLIDLLAAMPPPMVVEPDLDQRWVEGLDHDQQLFALMIRQHLQLACRFFQLDRPNQAGEQLERTVDVVLMASNAMGCPLSQETSQRVRALFLSELPVVLSAQVALQAAVRFGGLPRRLSFVLGMHRSGTSALTGMLAKAGLDVPDDLMDRPDDVINLRGYWESEGLMQVNDRLFRELGLHWSSSDQLPRDWSRTEQAKQWRQHLIRQLVRTCQGTQHPVIKDPRMCVLMEGMQPLIDAGACQLSFFIPVRDPLEVARSLQVAQNTSLGQGIALWMAHVIQAERWTRGLPRLIIGFQDLMQRPDSVLARCRLLLHQDGDSRDLAEEASGFIDPSLRRQRGVELQDQMSSEEQVLLARAKDLYQTLVSHQENDGEELRCKLDLFMPTGVTND